MSFWWILYLATIRIFNYIFIRFLLYEWCRFFFLYNKCVYDLIYQISKIKNLWNLKQWDNKFYCSIELPKKENVNQYSHKSFSFSQRTHFLVITYIRHTCGCPFHCFRFYYLCYPPIIDAYCIFSPQYLINFIICILDIYTWTT